MRKYIWWLGCVTILILALFYADLRRASAPRVRGETALAASPSHASRVQPRLHTRHGSANVSEAIALNDVIERSHFAFEDSRDGYVGGDATYRAQENRARTITANPTARSQARTSHVLSSSSRRR